MEANAWPDSIRKQVLRADDWMDQTLPFNEDAAFVFRQRHALFCRLLDDNLRMPSSQ